MRCVTAVTANDSDAETVAPKLSPRLIFCRGSLRPSCSLVFVPTTAEALPLALPLRPSCAVVLVGRAPVAEVEVVGAVAATAAAWLALSRNVAAGTLASPLKLASPVAAAAARLLPLSVAAAAVLGVTAAAAASKVAMEP